MQLARQRFNRAWYIALGNQMFLVAIISTLLISLSVCGVAWGGDCCKP